MQSSLSRYLSEIRQHSEVLQDQTRALKKAREKALEADRLKSAFIHNMTDQLVEPVSEISSSVAVIRQNSSHLEDIDVRQLTTGISDNTEKITSLLDKIIEISVNRSSVENEIPESDT
jgi:methyl-accepting chemotaxis protein/sigma-B regulation protein RsbU (phosphoserine phosphatase)